MGKALMSILAFLGVYLTSFTVLWNLFKDARSKLVTHYKIYKSDYQHATTKQIINFLKKRVSDFPLELGQCRSDENIMPYIIADLNRYNRLVLILNIMTLGIFRLLS